MHMKPWTVLSDESKRRKSRVFSNTDMDWDDNPWFGMEWEEAEGEQEVVCSAPTFGGEVVFSAPTCGGEVVCSAQTCGGEVVGPAPSRGEKGDRDNTLSCSPPICEVKKRKRSTEPDIVQSSYFGRCDFSSTAHVSVPITNQLRRKS